MGNSLKKRPNTTTLSSVIRMEPRTNTCVTWRERERESEAKLIHSVQLSNRKLIHLYIYLGRYVCVAQCHTENTVNDTHYRNHKHLEGRRGNNAHCILTQQRVEYTDTCSAHKRDVHGIDGIYGDH